VKLVHIAPVRTEPVVLVHGFGSSFEHGWREAGWIDLLEDVGRAVIPVDVLGHGTADAPHDPAAYANLEQCVAAVLPDTPVDAVGFSMGASLLLRLAVQDASRFARLVVIGVGENLFGGEGGSTLADAFERGRAEPEDVTARVFLSMAEKIGNDPLALAACSRRAADPFTDDELGRVTCPVLVILGDQDFVGSADRLVAALPDATLVTLRGLDHFQSPRDFGALDAALRFLDAV
jgi:pimeloyl-ACP methyl ester carboxylesterase